MNSYQGTAAIPHTENMVSIEVVLPIMLDPRHPPLSFRTIHQAYPRLRRLVARTLVSQGCVIDVWNPRFLLNTAVPQDSSPCYPSLEDIEIRAIDCSAFVDPLDPGKLQSLILHNCSKTQSFSLLFTPDRHGRPVSPFSKLRRLVVHNYPEASPYAQDDPIRQLLDRMLIESSPLSNGNGLEELDLVGASYSPNFWCKVVCNYHCPVLKKLRLLSEAEVIAHYNFQALADRCAMLEHLCLPIRLQQEYLDDLTVRFISVHLHPDAYAFT